MRCQQCGTVMRHSCYHRPTNRVLWPDCYPFVCSRCGTTEKTPLCIQMTDDRELCWD